MFFSFYETATPEFYSLSLPDALPISCRYVSDYEATPEGLKAMTALTVLRDKVLKPLLAASCQAKLSPEPDNSVTLDQQCENLHSSNRPISDALVFSD